MVKRFLHWAWAWFIGFISDPDRPFVFMLGLVAGLLFRAIACNGH